MNEHSEQYTTAGQSFPANGRRNNPTNAGIIATNVTTAVVPDSTCGNTRNRATCTKPPVNAACERAPSPPSDQTIPKTLSTAAYNAHAFGAQYA